MPGHLRGQMPRQNGVPPTCTPPFACSAPSRHQGEGWAAGGNQGSRAVQAPVVAGKPAPAGLAAAVLAGPVGESSGRPHAFALSRDGVPVQRQSPAGTGGHGGGLRPRRSTEPSTPQAATGVAAERIKTVMSTDDRKWVTRKDAAALARCSQDSIVRAQTKHKQGTRSSAGGSCAFAASRPRSKSTCSFGTCDCFGRRRQPPSPSPPTTSDAPAWTRGQSP